MNKETKKYLDSFDIKFKDVDGNGIEQELTLSELLEQLLEDNKRLGELISNLQKKLEEAIEDRDMYQSIVESWE